VGRLPAIGRAFGRRALGFGATLGLAAVAVVSLFALAPGDAIDALPNGPEVRDVLAAEWGLGGGFADRLAAGLGRLASGDLGHSLTWRPGAPVGELVAAGFAASATIGLPALFLGVAAGFGGAALRRGRAGPAVRLAEALSGVPVVLAGLAVVSAVNAATWALVERGVIGRPGWFALPEEPGLVRSTLAVLVLAFASARLAELVERAGAARDALLAAPFVDAERARGGPVGWLVARHLLVPAAQLAAAQLPACLSGLIVVERAFSLPGAGAMFWGSCGVRDWPLAAGLVLAAAALVAAARLAADTLALLLDPRTRTDAA
jgi:peptide/nickel transport system permease protein